MWLESHGNLARHPKTRRLMQRMGWSLPATLGNLHLLWYWALEYAPTGDLTKFEPGDLTHDLDLGDATPAEFIEAMIDAGFIDRSESGVSEFRSGGSMIESGCLDKNDDSVVLRLHDWPEYTAKSLRPRFRGNPGRWHHVLRSYGLPVITRRNSHRHTVASARQQIGPSRTPCSDHMVAPPKPDLTVPQTIPTEVSSANDGNEQSNAAAPQTGNFANGDASPTRIEIPKTLAAHPTSVRGGPGFSRSTKPRAVL